jgi:hypothetical protein
MHQSISYLNFVCRCYEGSRVMLIDDLKPTREPDFKVVDTLIVNLYSLFKNLWCWFWVGCWFYPAILNLAIWSHLANEFLLVLYVARVQVINSFPGSQKIWWPTRLVAGIPPRV